MFKSSGKSGTLYWVILVLWMIAFIVACIVRPINKVSNIREIEGTVTEKTVKNGKDNGTYLVFIEDESGSIIPLEVTDSLFRWRFNSSDVWGNIHQGQKYVFEVGGSRVEFMSWYPNIYSYREIE